MVGGALEGAAQDQGEHDQGGLADDRLPAAGLQGQEELLQDRLPLRAAADQGGHGVHHPHDRELRKGSVKRNENFDGINWMWNVSILVKIAFISLKTFSYHPIFSRVENITKFLQLARYLSANFNGIQ